MRITWVVAAMMRARVLGSGDRPRDTSDLPRVLPRYHVLSTCSFVQLVPTPPRLIYAGDRYKILADLCKRRDYLKEAEKMHTKDSVHK